MAEQKLILAYWKFQGLSQVSRYLLEYCGLAYENKLYTDWQQWFQKDSPELSKQGFFFVNLPYLIDGDFQLSESSAIEKYIIKKANKQNELLGKSIQEEGVIDMLIGVIKDYNQLLYTLINSKDLKNDKIKLYNESIKIFFELMTTHLGTNKFLTGNNVSYADFILYQTFQVFSIIFKVEFATFQRLVAFKHNFEEIPQIKQHQSSAGYLPDVVYPGLVEQLEL